MTAATGPGAVLAGRVALVTGGAQGIGRACAHALAGAGAAVAVADVAAAGAASVAEELRAAGARALELGVDVRDEAAMADAVARAGETLGPLDVLVHNAGGVGGAPAVPVTDMATADLEAVLGLNVVGTFVTCRAVARAMLAVPQPGHDRALVLVGSLQGLLGSPHLAGYGAAKAGVTHLATTLALELAPAGVRVNVVAPSMTATPAVEAKVTPERRRATEAAVPLGRIGRPGDVAAAALWLASPAAGFVTGQTIVVDGGLSLTTARPGRDVEARGAG